MEVILVNENDLLLSPKSYRGFVGFGMVDDVAVDNRAGGVAYQRRGGGWVGEVLRTASRPLQMLSKHSWALRAARVWDIIITSGVATSWVVLTDG